jgi:hypothetical protein
MFRSLRRDTPTAQPYVAIYDALREDETLLYVGGERQFTVIKLSFIRSKPVAEHVRVTSDAQLFAEYQQKMATYTETRAHVHGESLSELLLCLCGYGRDDVLRRVEWVRPNDKAQGLVLAVRMRHLSTVALLLERRIESEDRPIIHYLIMAIEGALTYFRGAAMIGLLLSRCAALYGPAMANDIIYGKRVRYTLYSELIFGANLTYLVADYGMNARAFLDREFALLPALGDDIRRAGADQHAKLALFMCIQCTGRGGAAIHLPKALLVMVCEIYRANWRMLA